MANKGRNNTKFAVSRDSKNDRCYYLEASRVITRNYADILRICQSLKGVYPDPDETGIFYDILANVNEALDEQLYDVVAKGGTVANSNVYHDIYTLSEFLFVLAKMIRYAHTKQD